MKHEKMIFNLGIFEKLSPQFTCTYATQPSPYFTVKSKLRFDLMKNELKTTDQLV